MVSFGFCINKDVITIHCMIRKTHKHTNKHTETQSEYHSDQLSDESFGIEENKMLRMIDQLIKLLS